MKRNKHSLSYYKLLTGDMGKLYPVACFEVLPGDSVQQATSLLLRVSPLVAPVMHPVTVRVHHWYVPNRLVWDGWEDFITGGNDGIGGSSGTVPMIDSTTGFAAKSLPDYFGIPPGVQNIEVSAMPIRAYNLIYNEFYRDQDLIPELAVPRTSGLDGQSPLTVQNICWEKDYFTSARPWAQRGPDVSLPLGIEAPVVTNEQNILLSSLAGATDRNLVHGASGNQMLYSGALVSGQPNVRFGSQTGLKADLTNATAVNVNDVREAFALQRYQEARAMYGSRYTEYLRYLGVRSSDARLQRPEYLGGGKQVIAFTEVLQTGPDTADEGVASLKGHGIAAMRSRRYRRFFEEHGTVLSLLSVRPRTMYNNGLERMWTRRTKEDYWQKELEHIGQQEVFRREVWAVQNGNAPGSTGEDVWGYQDRYAEYRHIQSKVAGDFRDTLDFWHLGRIFASNPNLNSDFVKCDPSKRVHAVQTDDVLWMMVNNSIQARRMVSRGGMPGRIV